MTEILRNMTRRPGRTGLTVIGIVIGVFALTVMGGMAEKINTMVAGGLNYYGNQVLVTQANSGAISGAPISIARGAEIQRVPGVAAVVPFVQLPLKTDNSAVGISLTGSDVVEGIGANVAGHEALTAAAGALPPLTERGVVAVGSSIASEYKLHVGDTLKVRGRPFTVKAILQTTMTVPDTMVRMNLADAQALFVGDLPPLLRHSVQASQIASGFDVYPASNVGSDLVAARIKRAGIPAISVMSSSELKKSVEQTSAIFNLVVIGSALIALIVGALSVINTMAMSVAERVKEIGLKKAIGARTGQVLREFLTEAATIGLLGGLIGLGLGALLVQLINGATASSGAQIFEITGRLAIGTVLFATILGAVAGFVPALRAARLNPVDALRTE